MERPILYKKHEVTYVPSWKDKTYPHPTYYESNCRIKLSLEQTAIDYVTGTVSYNWELTVSDSSDNPNGSTITNWYELYCYLDGETLFSCNRTSDVYNNPPTIPYRGTMATGSKTVSFDINGEYKPNIEMHCVTARTGLYDDEGEYFTYNEAIWFKSQAPFFLLPKRSNDRWSSSVKVFWESGATISDSPYNNTISARPVDEVAAKEILLTIPNVGSYKQYRLLLGKSGHKVWEYVIDNPAQGEHTGFFSIDGLGKRALYALVAAETPEGEAPPTAVSVYLSVYGTDADTNTERFLSTEPAPFRIILDTSAPTVIGKVVDTNAVTQVLTGDSSVLIRYHSNAEASIEVTPKGGAAITTTGITHNNITMENVASYNFEDASSNRFDFYAVDTRESRGVDTVIAPMVDYVRPTANLVAGTITGQGDLSFTISGQCFTGSFGVETNEIFVYYRYKKQNQSEDEYSDWILLSDVVFNSETNSYSINVAMEGLDYMEAYSFQASIADMLETVRSAEKIVVSLPVFDWSMNDFNFNVPVTIQGKQFAGSNPILWEGSDKMPASSNITLSEAVSAQVHGIVLAFAYYEGDVAWNTFYVPKEMVNLYNGGGHTFMMGLNAGLSIFGAKYLYISDTGISGHATNVDSGTAAIGIKFTNSNFVLRYVIGV